MSEFPSLKAELRPKLKQTPQAEISDEEVEANSRSVAQRWGLIPTPEQPERETLPRTPVVSVRGYIPKYLDDELARAAAGRRVTKTFLIVEALAKFGYRVDAIDLVEDRRKK